MNVHSRSSRLEATFLKAIKSVRHLGAPTKTIMLKQVQHSRRTRNQLELKKPT